jgi:Fe-S cluster assembly iron-binding protein IscA
VFILKAMRVVGFYSDKKNKFDEEVDEMGVRILIDPGALMHVVGTKMDFVEDRLKCAPVDCLSVTHKQPFETN